VKSVAEAASTFARGSRRLRRYRRGRAWQLSAACCSSEGVHPSRSEKKAKELFNCAHSVVEAAIEAFAADAIGEVDDAAKFLMRWT
jgi:hypothetical protein